MIFMPEDFVRESNRIEGIHRDPTKAEIDEYHRFMALDAVTIQDMEDFVRVYQPDAHLRVSRGMNVRVGSYYPPPGGPAIGFALQEILDYAAENRNSRGAYEAHQRYEHLHPFLDGNGRSGRMLWMWQMREAPLGFLHRFYYQALDGWRDHDFYQKTENKPQKEGVQEGSV